MLYITSLALVISLSFNIFLLICIKKTFNQVDILEDWIIDFKTLINNTYNKLKEIDERGMFEKDDDVGVVYTDILSIVKSANDKVQIINQSTNVNEKIKEN
jgi:hypothetical protein